MPRRSILLFAGACVAVAAALALITVIVVGGRERSAEAVAAQGTASIGGPFQMVDQRGQPVDQTLLEGKWTLVFFGFTYCPDYCPTTLAMLKAVQDELGDRARDLQIVFVSVDPERDTPQALADYLSSDGFPTGVIGLTGSPEQVAQMARAYRAYYRKNGSGETYTMDHSLTVYLMGPDGRFRSPLAHDLGPERAAQVIEGAMRRG